MGDHEIIKYWTTNETGNRKHIVTPNGYTICGNFVGARYRSAEFEPPPIMRLCANCYKKMLQHGHDPRLVPTEPADYIPVTNALTAVCGGQSIYVGDLVQVNNERTLRGIVRYVDNKAGQVTVYRRIPSDFQSPIHLNLTTILTEQVSYFALWQDGHYPNMS